MNPPARIEIDGQLIDFNQELVDSLLGDAAMNPFRHEGVKAYYRRRQRDGLVKVWLRNDRTKFELVASPDFAAQLKPNVPVTFDFSF